MAEIISSFRGVYSYLSNFDDHPVTFNGLEFDSAEAAYQADKSDDPEVKESFMFMTPSQAKKEGRRVKMRPNFESEKVKVMQEIVVCKFMQNPELMDKLQATGDTLIIEGNTWHDNFWGSCVCGRKSCSAQGKNVLGKILMQVRETSLNNMELLKEINERNL